MKTLPIALFVGLALLAGSTANAAGRAVPHRGFLGVIPHRGIPAATSRASSRTPAAATRGATCGLSCTDYEAAVNQYFADVAHDSGTMANVYSVATQYAGTNGTVAYNVAFAGSTVDTSSYPARQCNDTVAGAGDTHCLTDTQLGAEIKKVIAANGWPTGLANLYFILTPTNVGVCFSAGSVARGDDCSTNSFCAYHNSTVANGSPVVYGVEPDDETIPTGGCDFKVQDPNNANVDPTLNTLSHEQNEAITDPLGDAWFASDGSENGDLCAWTFGAPLGGDVSLGTAYNQVINGHNYWLQEEYSNLATATGGCVQQLGGPANPPDPALKGSDGTGPLLYSGGPVMPTNTVRAIYWIPEPPVNSRLPVISGAATVGKKLRASHGTWTNSPTSFRYQWLRCSAQGASCKRIPRATKPAYTLGLHDAKHRLRVRVTAVSTAGSGTAVSGATHLARRR